MKKIFTLLTVLMLGVASFTQAGPKHFVAQTDTAKHMTKSGKPDMRYKSNKSTTMTTKSGKKDMRYKANNPNAGKKTTTTPATTPPAKQ